MSKRINLSLLYLAGILLFFSCDEKETIPSYISIDKIQLTTDPNTEGWATEEIKDAWVYINNELIGAFELDEDNPIEFPVLLEGIYNISIGPGIFLNGISSTRTEYPFYRFYQSTIELKPEQTTTISPEVTYFTDITFSWIEDFEGIGFTMSTTTPSDTSMAKIDASSNTNVEYGNGAGYIALDTSHDFFEIKSDDGFNLPTNTSPVFIEIDYKCTIPFTVGIFANQPTQIDQEPIVVINPSKNWNKMYIELAFTLNKYPNANDFNIFIGTFLDSDQTFGEVFIDNIKLIKNQ